ncbi:MAG: acyl--CoA ligase [Proteobacteria bacterium]|nr:acyl--CoA ligase [Pseudomonadota bacterium]
MRWVDRLRHRLACWLVGRFRVPRDAVRWACQRYAGRLALVTPSGQWTFRALHERSLRLAQALQSAGLQPGELLLYQLHDEHELVELRLAAWECGAVAACLPDFADAAAARALLGCVQPRVVITSPDLPLAAAAPPPGARRVLTGPDYEAWLAAHPPLPAAVPVAPDDVAVLVTTSGTTGAPKLMASTHGAQMRSLQMLLANADLSGPAAPAGPCLTAIPLCGAGSGMLFPALLSGSPLVIPPSRDTAAWVDCAARHGVTRLFVTPSQLIDLLELPDAPRRLAAVRQLVYGTESMPVPKLTEALQRFGPILQQGYGSAEVLPPLALMSAPAHAGALAGQPRRLGSCGRVVAGVELRIVDDQGRDLPAGEVGAVLVRSPTRFAGYWGAHGLVPAGDDWLAMGDLGRVDADGDLFILGRQADLVQVQRRGVLLPVYPREVEDAAHRHPAVREAVLVQPPAADGPGPVWLVVSLRRSAGGRGAADWAAELTGHLRPLLPAHALPDRVRVLEALPRSPLGKVLRREVRDALAAHRY